MQASETPTKEDKTLTNEISFSEQKIDSPEIISSVPIDIPELKHDMLQHDENNLIDSDSLCSKLSLCSPSEGKNFEEWLNNHVYGSTPDYA